MKEGALLEEEVRENCEAEEEERRNGCVRGRRWWTAGR